MEEIIAFGELLEILQASGGVGVWVLAWIVWRFDRRLLRLEWIARRLGCPLRTAEAPGLADHVQSPFEAGSDQR